MEQSNKHTSSVSERRYVLADRFQPKVVHELDTAESRSFGHGTPATRRTVRPVEKRNDEDLQNSIKSILSRFE